jgi:hypothetical protein
VRRLAHRLRSPGQNDSGLAQHDLLGGLGYRFEPGAAEAIDGDRGRLYRDARTEPDVPCQINSVRRRLKDIPKDNVVHGFRLGPATLERGLRRDHPQVGGRQVFEGTPEGTEPGPGSGKKDYS